MCVGKSQESRSPNPRSAFEAGREFEGSAAADSPSPKTLSDSRHEGRTWSLCPSKRGAQGVHVESEVL
ncbi:MAG: hypothetical protein Q8P67_12670 [archaeon]|nr:hypothetical protein [archaeon]